MKKTLPEYNKIKWIHKIKFPDGKITPGKWDAHFDEYGLTTLNYKNKKVLDIGCLDGLYSFYAEEKGAKEIISIDINEEQFGQQKYKNKQWSHGYLYAHQKLKSKAKYVFPYSVYDLTPNIFGKFDTVLFLGVFYHLAHPLLSLERINSVMKKNSILVLETEISNTYSNLFYQDRYNPKIKEIYLKNNSNQLLNKKVINILLTVFNQPKEFLSVLIQKIKGLIWLLVSPFISNKEGIYKKDKSNFWIFETSVIEKSLNLAGFKIESKLHIPLSCRVTYVCRKMDNFNDSYSDNSKYTNYKKRISNLTFFNKRK